MITKNKRSSLRSHRCLFEWFFNHCDWEIFLGGFDSQSYQKFCLLRTLLFEKYLRFFSTAALLVKFIEKKKLRIRKKSLFWILEFFASFAQIIVKIWFFFSLLGIFKFKSRVLNQIRNWIEKTFPFSFIQFVAYTINEVLFLNPP